jgi:hypothetical protein
MPNHKELLSSLSKQQYYLNKIYAAMSSDLSKVLKQYKLNTNSNLWFKNAEVKKQVEKVLSKHRKIIYNHISNNVSDAWNMANNHNDSFVNNYIKGITIPNDKLYFQRNNEALKSFLKRQSNGLDLSNRVWNLSNQTKSQLEYFIADGLTEGRSAAKLAQDLQRYLKQPDKRFRRIRSKITGKLIISDPASKYKPGQGVYRSSYKNALRLARNEINIAYRTSDFERRKQLPFVTGITVHLSNAHPKYDICDELIGDYPKEFVFTGWHPNCLCYTTSKLLSKKDFIKQLKKENLNFSKTESIPNAANRFLFYNSNKIKGYKSKPYFIKDNFDLGKDGYKIKKSIGTHIPYVEIPDVRAELISIGSKFKKDYEIVFNQEDKNRNAMMKNFLVRAKSFEDPKLILEQKASIHGYTTNQIYEDLNKLLRGTKEFSRNKNYTEFLNSYANVLDDSLSKLPNYKGPVYRGTRLSDELINKYKIAFKNKKAIEETFFQSTSFDSDKAFRGNVRFLINVKSGKKIDTYSAFKSESEVLLKRKTNYKVYDIKENGSITEIYMEEI